MTVFLKKYQFWLKCWGIVWGILAIVFSFYMVTFFLGNHDWQYLRYDMPLGDGMWEARMTQFVPPRLFSLGRMLPIWNALLGFMFLSGATVLLAWWYQLKPKMLVVVLFCLLIGLHPYVCTSLYYAYLFLSFGCWHFLTVLGVMLAWQFAENHKFKYFIGAMICLWSALSGYVACIELIGVIVIGKLLLECGASFHKADVKKWMVFLLAILAGIGIYALSLKVLQYSGILDLGMYNTQTLSLAQVISRFMQKWQEPFAILNVDFPYIGRKGVLLFWGLVLIFNLVLWRICGLKKYVLMLFLELGLFWAAFAAAYISSHSIFGMFRVHAFSVPYLVGVMFAFILLKGDNFYRNAAYVISVCLLYVFMECNFMAQKVWYLGNGQDDKAVERVKGALLPQIEPHKHYRLSTLSNLQGQRKFARKQFVAVTIYAEYYNMSYFLDIFFSNGFFAYEAYNPIWGDSQYVPRGVIFYGTTNENITPKQKMEASLFAQHFGKDKDNLIKAVRRLRPFPREPYMAVGEKDIILMLGDTANKDLLVKTIQDN